MKILVIHVPRSLLEMPHTWSHDLLLEIAELEKTGQPLGLIDNAQQRFDIEVVKDHVRRVDPGKLILYGGLDRFLVLEQYLKVFPDAVVWGFPPDTIPSLPVESSAIPPEAPDELDPPNWGFLPLDAYFANSAWVANADTAVATKRAVYKTRWGIITQSADKVARDLLHLRLVYGFDFLEFDEDLSVDWTRSLQLLQELEDRDLQGLFKWSCRASPTRVNIDYLSEIRRRGCTLVDYGEVPVTQVRDPKAMARLEVALHATRSTLLTPLVTAVLGDPDTTRDDVVEMAKFLKANDLETRPLLKPYAPSEKDSLEKRERRLRQSNEGFVNATRWSDESLLGIAELMARGDVERLEKVNNQL